MTGTRSQYRDGLLLSGSYKSVNYRNLANHRVGVVVCVPHKFVVDSHSKTTTTTTSASSSSSSSSLLSTEMKLLKLTDAKIVHSINGETLVQLVNLILNSSFKRRGYTYQN